MRVASFTLLALIGFAANSVLCRLALGGGAIDAASFSTLRLAAGAIALTAMVGLRERSRFRVAGSWTSAAMLLLYAVPFSFAYLELTTGTGALILFGAVQITMLAAAVRGGERPRLAQWLGFVLALGGLVVLVAPGLAAPPWRGAILMATAGVGWGFYSLLGRGRSNPLAHTTGNFLRAVPAVVLVSLLSLRSLEVSATGTGFAIASGALASGVGYAIWYRALRDLTATRAAAVQLAVPVLAAMGGVALLGEVISLRLAVASTLVLGGVALALGTRRR